MKMTSVKQKVRIGAIILTALAMGSALPALAQDSIVRENGEILASATYKPGRNKFIVDDNRGDERIAYVKWTVDGVTDDCPDRGGATSPPAECKVNTTSGRPIVWRLCVTQKNSDNFKNPYKCDREVRERT
jgi:hypothetical protein